MAERVVLDNELDAPWLIPNPVGYIMKLPASVFPIPGRFGLGRPMLQASIQPSGVMDLLLVKQALQRYQARDIAHIENVLAGESKTREHRRRTMTEETFLTETETTREEERDFESTARFEMQTEVAETLKQDSKLEAGLKVSGSYGPMVEFEASASGTIAESRERFDQAGDRIRHRCHRAVPEQALGAN